MRSDGCVEMCCDIWRYQDRSEQPHFRSVFDCVAGCLLVIASSAGKLQMSAPGRLRFAST
jgi:hypothetical protein